MNWTNEEVKNSQEIARYFRRRIKYGDWYLPNWQRNYPILNYCVSHPRGRRMWALSDCLEWLTLRKLFPILQRVEDGQWQCRWITRKERTLNIWKETWGSIPTAAAQLAVLEILKGK